MAYADLTTVQATDPGDPLTAAWCDQVRDNDEFFIDPPACSVDGLGSPQSVADSTLVVLSAPNEKFDNDSMHSTSSNTSRITAQTAGRYLIGATVNWQQILENNVPLLLNIIRNGGGAGDAFNIAQLPAINRSGFTTAMSGALTLVLAAGDYVEARVRQDNSLNVAINCTLEEFYAIFLTRG